MSAHSKVISVIARMCLFAALVIGSGFLAGCAAPAAAPTATPTLAPTDTPIPTATSTPTETPTPVPTNTPTATPTQDMTKVANATATQQMADNLKKIEPDLKIMGFTLSDGTLAYFNIAPYDMSLDQYGTNNISRVTKETYKDFVIQSDVTWDTELGLSGCGYYLRHSNDLKSGYDFRIIRLQNAPLWFIVYRDFGTVQGNISGQKYSNKINDKKGSTNKLAVVVKGSNITPYINGEKMDTITHSKLTEGMISYMIANESGKTSCRFENNWIFTLK